MKLMNMNFSQGVNKLFAHLPSKYVDIISNVAHRMALHFFIRDIALKWNFFPFKIFAVGRSGGDDFAGPPPCGSADSIAVEDDVIIKGAKFINNSWIFFIDDILFSNFKFELEASILFKWKIYDTALG